MPPSSYRLPVVTGSAATILYALAGCACLMAALLVGRARAGARAERSSAAIALGLSAVWCFATALMGYRAPIVAAAEIVRDIAWTVALFRHFANDGRDEKLLLVRPVVLSLLGVEALQLLILIVFAPTEDTLLVSALLHMLMAVGSLVLLHNLFVGATPSSRKLLAWNSGGLALLWGFDLNLYTLAYLTDGRAGPMDVLRALTMIAVASCLAIGMVQRAKGVTFRPSRAMTFNTLSIVVLTAYFLVMIGLSNGLGAMAGDLAVATQAGFLLAVGVATIIWLPSRRLRAAWRILALKHLFQHRYDYREEWLRFARTIGKGDADGSNLQTRAIQVLADITESPAGILLVPDDDRSLTLAAQWRWSSITPTCGHDTPALVRLLEQHRLIIDFDEVRAGVNHHGELALIPGYLTAQPQAWAGVPLVLGGRLMALAILARPALDRRLDWEDFDLLEIVGQQIASHLSEQASQDALREAAQFDAFNRRMAFVMHDIKNLSSQLGLLARNAERHSENPAFRADMLITLRNSADKLSALVSRLGRYGKLGADKLVPVDIAELARAAVARRRGLHAIEYHGESECIVEAHREPLEQALDHLIQNALDASEPGVPVVVDVAIAEFRGEIAVRDAGVGMSAHFVRNELFRPFASTKETGFGIGACEARDLVRAMNGRLSVDSRQGAGSCFTISLPLKEASDLLKRSADRGLRDGTLPQDIAA